MNQIDTLYHITNFDDLKIILKEGFKPSYAVEYLGQRKVLIPMVSFSNILLRDIGENEVISYGEYGVGFSRNWAISKNINPVIYTYEKGEAQVSLSSYLDNSVFVSRLSHFKEYFKKWTECKCGTFSSSISLTNTSKEALALADYVSLKYNEELVEHLSSYANSIYQASKPIIFLTKPYLVLNKEGEQKVAYNDREWRKTFLDLDFHVEDSDEFQHWIKQKKPHFHQEEYRLTFKIPEISVILLKEESEIKEVIDILKINCSETEIEELLSKRKMFIGTKDKLIADGF
ncbi:abortive infection system antitoxin AbiGi family protein [Ferruginibacter sp. SUN002]|uniref:abortive infection system antitoxin AbiGi family protein n=1 Tax=Ferruginibacter sp. SUN002 TaxID=2937789 RepID=UPI003D36EE67